MDPAAIIESYVDDVIRRLPHRQRQDVGLELRSLLNEELDANARDAARPADEAMTLELLRSFGLPRDVADRYRPAGFLIIRPVQARTFAWTAMGGLVLQWAFSLPGLLSAPDAALGVQRWFLTWGLGAFWWPGFLVTMHLIAAWLGQGGDDPKAWKPVQSLDRDRVNRPLLALALVFWFAGAAVLVALPWLRDLWPSAPPHLLAALAFDDSFLRGRAVWVLPLWIASFALAGAVLIEGRWSLRARRLESALAVAWVALLAWFLFGGRIFALDPAEKTTKLAMALIALGSLAGLAANLFRERRRIRGLPPSANGAKA